MSTPRIAVLTGLTMIAFAGNSVLCRLALRETAIDAASFTTIRLLSGGLTLGLFLAWRRSSPSSGGSWWSAVALFVYAACFSFAYLNLPAGTGALILFGAVQLSMIGYGWWMGERLRAVQWLGLTLALAGLLILLWPGISAPQPTAFLLMLMAGLAWGIYSLRGQSAGDAIGQTAGNFLRAVPFALLLSLADWSRLSIDPSGVLYAVASGALASGLGYALWYSVLPELRAATAAVIQLSVPLLAALGGIVLLGEDWTLRLILSALAILGGIALVLLSRDRLRPPLR